MVWGIKKEESGVTSGFYLAGQDLVKAEIDFRRKQNIKIMSSLPDTQSDMILPGYKITENLTGRGLKANTSLFFLQNKESEDW